MEFSDAKALVTIDGARRKGKTAPIKQQVDEKVGEVKSIETIFVIRHTGEDCEMQDGRDVWFDQALEAADDECEPEPLDAEHPLYVLTSGSTAKPLWGKTHRWRHWASPGRTATCRPEA